ncbi:MAG: TetR/AcrR family transcriptional regulator [Brachybacterium sp.]|nr:TetR/AcrR family transcriptional regulator [Brachybacterium sp.]MDN5900741.1 TetR/AcrR family transcriptional regulator [Brachybacterium sp.]
MASAPRPVGPRALVRARTMEQIIELGNAQLVEQGATGLSVRGIARGLGMVSSAIYRYVGSRDELLTLLISDAYADLADTVDAAVATAEAGTGGDPRARFLALGDAMCAWAITHPERWTLLYGTPVRDYSAPADTTNADGTRVMQVVLRIAADAAEQGDDGARVAPGEADLAPEVIALLESHLAEFGVETTPATEFAALTVWSSLVGVISAHVFGQLGADAAAIGERILDAQIRMLAELITRC